MLSQEKIPFWNGQRFGLVLSGGGAKGAYEAGVFRALYALDFADKVKAVSGTSVGALNTLIFAMQDVELAQTLWSKIGLRNILSPSDKMERGQLREVMRHISPDTLEIEALPSLLLELSRSNVSPFTQAGLRSLLWKTVDFQRIRHSGMALYACAYDVEALKPVYFHLNALSDEEIIDAVLASAAIPYLFQPVSLGGRLYADGGVNNPAYPVPNGDVTPIAPMKGLPLDRILVIHLRHDVHPGYDEFCGVPVTHIIPSRPLEPVHGAGTMNFSHGALLEKLALGYQDALSVLAPLAMGYLKAE